MTMQFEVIDSAPRDLMPKNMTDQRCAEITHDPLLFIVAQGIFWLSTERLSRSVLHLKEGGKGSLYSCTLLYRNCDVLHRRLGADSDKIRQSWDLYLYFPSLCGRWNFPLWGGWVSSRFKNVWTYILKMLPIYIQVATPRKNLINFVYSRACKINTGKFSVDQALFKRKQTCGFGIYKTTQLFNPRLTMRWVTKLQEDG